MNQRDTLLRIQKTKQLLKYTDRCHVNCIRFSSANTVKHELKKAEIAGQLLKAGNKFVTEATFLTGGRADIVDLTNAIAYEIVNTESEKSILKKKLKYPIPIIVIKTD